MSFELFSEPLAADATVNELCRRLFEYAKQAPGATEICLNRPGELFVEAGANWHRFEAPDLTFQWALSLATAIATYTEQSIGTMNPILSAMLSGGERVQIVLPPAVEQGTISMSIRIPSPAVKSLEVYEEDGAFNRYRWAKPGALAKPSTDAALLDGLNSEDQELCSLLARNDLATFIRSAVAAKKNIAVTGDTGSGKTTLMKSISQHIRSSERLITIEDVRELFLPNHPNRVHLLYSKGGQGVAKITPADLIASCMRMKPDRVLLAELRGGEAFDFLKLLTTGHSGSITSFHAESIGLAAERYVLMCKEHADAGVFDATALKRMVTMTIDVVLHVVAKVVYGSDGRPSHKERYVAEVAFDPVSKLRTQLGDNALHSARAH